MAEDKMAIIKKDGTFVYYNTYYNIYLIAARNNGKN